MPGRLGRLLGLPGQITRTSLPVSRRRESRRGGRGLRARLSGYRKEIGPNAYAVFNTMTDIAARPPENRYFQKDRDTIEKRSGRWLKELGRRSQDPKFDLNEWIPKWEVPAPTGRPSPVGTEIRPA